MIAPWLTTPAVLLAVPVKWRDPAARSASAMSRVEATRPPTLTCEPTPKIRPWGLMRNTWPLAWRLPRMRLPLTSAMRLTAMAEALGWLKRTVSAAATSKVAQLSERRLEA